MKKLAMLFFAFSALMVPGAFAADKSDVWDMLQRIDSELRHYDQSPRDLDRTMAKLHEALAILRGDQGAEPDACLDFAFEEYVKDGFSNSLAMSKSKAFCQQVDSKGMSMRVVRFFYERLKEDGYNASLALDSALSLGSGTDERGLPCVEKAYGRYRSDGFGARLSLQKAAQFCRS